ncbi:hypothetical protein PR003_g32721, partial [Phytophthora rubi]
SDATSSNTTPISGYTTATNHVGSDATGANADSTTISGYSYTMFM